MKNKCFESIFFFALHFPLKFYRFQLHGSDEKIHFGVEWNTWELLSGQTTGWLQSLSNARYCAAFQLRAGSCQTKAFMMWPQTVFSPPSTLHRVRSPVDSAAMKISIKLIRKLIQSIVDLYQPSHFIPRVLKNDKELSLITTLVYCFVVNWLRLRQKRNEVKWDLSRTNVSTTPTSFRLTNFH